MSRDITVPYLTGNFVMDLVLVVVVLPIVTDSTMLQHQFLQIVPQQLRRVPLAVERSLISPARIGYSSQTIHNDTMEIVTTV